jgi:hypothetical protein
VDFRLGFSISPVKRAAVSAAIAAGLIDFNLFPESGRARNVHPFHNQIFVGLGDDFGHCTRGCIVHFDGQNGCSHHMTREVKGSCILSGLQRPSL